MLTPQIKYTICIEFKTYSTARFKLDAREHVLASVNTFSSSSQLMLASKLYLLSSMNQLLTLASILLASINTFSSSSR